MSLVRWRSRALSFAPHVVVADQWLTACTHRLWTVLAFGSYQRVLRVDARRARIWLRERCWWRSRSRELAFDEVDHIAYRFAPFVTEFFTSVNDGRWSITSGDQLERYLLELVLRNGDIVPLFAFVGEGSVMTGGLGVLLGDEWLDMEGAQEEDSRALVRQLMRLTGLGLAPRSTREIAERLGTRCGACGQLSTRRVKCLYCGAALAEAEAVAVAPGGDAEASAARTRR